MKLFDSHAHCDDKRFDTEYEGGTLKLIEDCFNDNIGYIINIGTNLENSKVSVDLAHRFENLYASCGIHPSDVFYEDADKAISVIEDLLKDEKAVALGEIGLDYHYENVPRDLQMVYFRKQMDLAKKLGIPVIIHDRDAHGDVMEVLRKYKGVRGVLHSFSGSVEMAEELVDLGYMISLSGTLTFTNARKPKEVAAAIDISKLLIETDCPYLAPHPKRGQLNHSGNLIFTSYALSQIKGIDEREVARITEENALRFFGIK